MVNVQPDEALGYAVSREMAILYGVVLGGYVALFLSGWFGANWAIRGGGAGLLGQLVAVVLFAVGFVVVLVGIVGLVYKVIADANRNAAL